MKDARKDIIFRDEHYKEKFRIKDGDRIKITVAYDGEEIVRKCRFIDVCHMNVGSTPFHMDEFMEKQMKVGNKYEPAPGRKPALDILLAEPGIPLRDAEIPLNFAALKRMLGGPLETTALTKSAAIVRGKHGNGKIAVFGLNDGELTSLHPYDAQKYKYELTLQAREAITGEPSSLQQQLAAAKKDVAAQNQARAAAPPEKATRRKKDGTER